MLCFDTLCCVLCAVQACLGWAPGDCVHGPCRHPAADCGALSPGRNHHFRDHGRGPGATSEYNSGGAATPVSNREGVWEGWDRTVVPPGRCGRGTTREYSFVGTITHVGDRGRAGADGMGRGLWAWDRAVVGLESVSVIGLARSVSPGCVWHLAVCVALCPPCYPSLPHPSLLLPV